MMFERTGCVFSIENGINIIFLARDSVPADLWLLWVISAILIYSGISDNTYPPFDPKKPEYYKLKKLIINMAHIAAGVGIIWFSVYKYTKIDRD